MQALSVVVVISGPAISFCLKVLCFLPRLRFKLYVNHDCVFANASLHCYSAFELWELSDFLPLFTAVYRLCFKFTIR